MNNVTEGASILEQEETMVGKSKGPYYKMKIEGHGWLLMQTRRQIPICTFLYVRMKMTLV